MTREDADFSSDGTRCAAWRYRGEGEALSGPGGRPCVVMVHGLGGTRDSGLEPFAERLAAAGADVLLFDFRCLGASDGEPRGLVAIARQRADFHAAIAHARGLDGVDPERIVLWGVSLAGGHVLDVGADDGRIAAIVALMPAADSFVALRGAIRRDGPAASARRSALAARDLAASLRGRPPVRVPIVGAPGSNAVLTAPGVLEGMLAAAGPTWRNEICARVLLELGTLRPGKRAAELRCPVLFQVADLDQTLPPAPVIAAAWAAPGYARVRHYPCDHLDVFVPHEWFAQVADHQAQFLADVLTPVLTPA